MRKSGKKNKPKKSRVAALISFCLAVLLVSTNAESFVQAFGQAKQSASDSNLKITASIEDGQAISPDDKIELRLSRELKGSEGRLAVLIGQTDLTSLFTLFKQTLTYNRRILPLPVGEHALTVYLVSPAEEWQEIARFTLRVTNQKTETRQTVSINRTAEKPPTDPASEKVEATLTQTQTQATAATETPAPIKPNEKADELAAPEKPSASAANHETTTTAAPGDASAAATSATATSATATNGGATTTQGDTAKKRGGFEKLDFSPSLTLSYKSQAAESHFPESTRPARPTFSDIALQGSFRSEATRGTFISQNQFDIAGSSFQQEALRFGQLGDRAPQIDLASYLMQFQVDKTKFVVGHTTYGNNRLLVNGFSSRGITVILPLRQGLDFSLAAMNGTSVVGIENFFGLGRRQHQILSGTLGADFIKSRPNGLRLEVSYFNGYIQALNNVSQGQINDVERSRGLGVRLLASDAKQRFRFDGGLARSKFINPADPLLDQGRDLVAVPELAKNARYIETGFDILKDLAVSKTKKATLTFTLRHETVDPLYRSLGASTQADKTQNQFELTGNLGEITSQFSLIRFNDNLRDIPSILKSLSRAERFSIGAPLLSVVGNPDKPNQFLPRVSYTIDRIHQLGAAIPVNGGFEIAPDTIPDFLGTNQSFTSDWQIDKLKLGYRFNHSVQNNQQIGRQLADLFNLVHAISTGISATKALDLNFEFSLEQAKSIETRKIDRTFRLANTINWRMTERNIIAANLSHTLLGDTAKTNRNRNLELDLQWSYQFTIGKEKFKKLQGQSFIRYANRYANARDFAFGLTNRTKAQTLNIGMSFTFF
jgi:hypothetical protein